MRQTIGRPKKLRNKTNDELNNPYVLLRRLSTITYNKYREMRHNKRSCKGKRATNIATPKEGNKAKKTKTNKGSK